MGSFFSIFKRKSDIDVLLDNMEYKASYTTLKKQNTIDKKNRRKYRYFYFC